MILIEIFDLLQLINLIFFSPFFSGNNSSFFSLCELYVVWKQHRITKYYRVNRRKKRYVFFIV
jgi:hypothetical protein